MLGAYRLSGTLLGAVDTTANTLETFIIPMFLWSLYCK